MNFTESDIVRLLGLDNLEIINKHDIKKAYKKMSLKYHPDINSEMDEASTEISKVINAVYSSTHELFKKIEEFNNPVYLKAKKVELFSINNPNTRDLTVEIINTLYNDGMKADVLLNFLNAMEFGMITGIGFRKINELFGEEFCDELSNCLMASYNNNNLLFYQSICKMYYSIQKNKIIKKRK